MLFGIGKLLSFCFSCLLLGITISANAQQIFTLKGKVTTFEGKPLSEISISVRNKNFRADMIVATDSLGNYALNNISNGDTIYFSGSQIKTYMEIVNGNNYILTRVPLFRQQITGASIEAETDSIPVYGQNLNRKHTLSSSEVSTGIFPNYAEIKVKPYKGWREYNKLVSKELKYPMTALKHNVQGTVVLGFTITAKGELKHLKVIKGVGYGCDEEALRILRIPNKWAPGIQNGHPIEGEVEYSISFKLKKK